MRGWRESKEVAGGIAHAEVVPGRGERALSVGEAPRGVVEEVVAAALGFQQQRNGGVAADVDAGDGVQLGGDFLGAWGGP